MLSKNSPKKNPPKTSNLTPEGKRILQILQVEYQMVPDAAMRLMRDGGVLLAIALLKR